MTSLRSPGRVDFRVLAFLLVASLVTVVPAPLLPSFGMGGDVTFHLRWQQSLADTLFSHGSWAWLDDLNLGFGSPAFFFYPPTSHILTAILSKLVLFDTPDIGLRLTAGILVASLLGATGLYLFMKDLTASRSAALFAALVYTYAPYHIVIDPYFRGAYAETWAFAWPPFVLLGINWLHSRPIRGVILVSVGLAATLTTHAPSSIGLLPVFGVYGLSRAADKGVFPTGILGLFAASLGFGLSAFYLSTALTLIPFIPSEHLFGGRSDSVNWLIGGSEWPDTAIQKAIYSAVIIQLPVSVLFTVCALWRPASNVPRWMILLLAALNIAMFFLMSSGSHWLWALQSVANRMQFPWRLLLVQCLLMAILSGVFFANVVSRGSAKLKLALIWLVPFILLASSAAIYGGKLYRDAQLGRSMPRDRSGARDSLDAPEYQLGPVASLAARMPDGARASVIDGKAQIRVLTWSPRDIAMAVDASTPSRIMVRQFNFTGWTYSLDGQPSGSSGGSAGASGAPVEISVPAGSHQLRLRLLPTAAERLGKQVSIASLAILLLVAGVGAVGAGRRASRPAAG